jgi:hypothetical protein
MAHLPEESKLKFKLGGNLLMVALGLVGLGLVLIALQILMPWHPEAVDHSPAAAVEQMHESGSPHEKAGEATHEGATQHHEQAASAGHGEEPGAMSHGEEGGGHHGPGLHARLFMSLHLALLVALPMGLGGIFFVAFNHLSGAGWSVTVRRLAENYVWFLPAVLILMAVIFFGGGFGDVFSHWMHPHDPNDPVLAAKSAWLSQGFFQIRNMLWVIVWIAFGGVFWFLSTSQDTNPEFGKTRLMIRLGAIFLIIFGLTYSASAWDLSMSLEPHWFSTMWGIYIFAGLAITTYATMIMWIWFLKRNGYYAGTVNVNHWHDLGKYMFGHTIFWAYIGFSQFMLIWYAHIPEETIFYHKRVFNPDMTVNAWYYVGIVLIMTRFVLPFFLIIRRDAKRNLNFLAAVAALHFVGQIVDMYWISYPTLNNGAFVMFGWRELGPLFLMIGLFILSVGYGLSRASLIPLKDPKLEDALHWHQ